MEEIRIYRQTNLSFREDVPGARMWAVALKKSMLTFFELAANTVFPSHSHEAEQITLVLEGEISFSFDGKTFALKAGDVIAIPSNMEHSAFTGDKACRAVDAWSPIRNEYL